MKRLSFLALAMGITAVGWVDNPARPAGKNAQPRVQYARDIQPILSSNCFACHGPDARTRKAGLRLDIPEEALKKLKSGSRAIVPGNAKASELVARILAPTDRERMPPAKSNKHLKEPEKQLLKRWIEEGAEYQKHWAFAPPQRPTLPATKNKTWARNSIDHFVLARLEQEGLTPAPEADRYTLARRLAIDLTGLPPTIEAVDRFVNDKSPDAYEKYVDSVFRSPAYGERWAQVWLDLARYADSNGYATDNPRTIWKYRDWVIDAINANMPFAQFTIEQIAGDLLPKATPEQMIATAFHRNTLTNDEGGTSDEEFRVAAVVDRVNTTMQVWMGITMGCAQCHDHKYDPISQEEYFRMYAILNQTQDSDKSDNSPLWTTPIPEQEKQKVKIKAKLSVLEKQFDQQTPELAAAQKRWEADPKKDKLPANIKAILGFEPGKRNPTQQTELSKYFRSIAPELKKQRDQIAGLRKQLAGLNGITTPIMRELPDNQKRKTKIHIRGNFLSEGKEVTPGVPAVFHALPKDMPASRVALARWLVDPQNPLTARVTVNRYWEQIFGVGLVQTPEDFGIRGKLPNHPDLLDWLATEFVAQKWDVKKLLHLLVTSATYRQSSRVTPELLKHDPDNRLFARGPRFRSSAEVIRDQALFIGGLLSPKMHGPPVRPPRPKSGLTAAFGGGTDWETSSGEDKYRRALYTQWRRTTPYPSMITFDAPGRTVCTVTRPRTNTPLQALVTLNDPVFVEAAQALARRMVKEGGKTIEEKARHGFRLALTRPPQEIELRRLTDLYQKAHSEYARNAKDALVMATSPLGPLPAGMDPADLAAWTIVGNVLLNLDEMFAKR
jgi:mono/diheme cytochrome c family protein